MSEQSFGRIAVVGGCGFIGSRLANRAATLGMDVDVLDIASNPPDLDERCRVRFSDVTAPRELEGAFDHSDVVFLLAAKLAKQCDEDPALGWATNVGGVKNVLDELLRIDSRARVVFVSSGAVYDSE